MGQFAVYRNKDPRTKATFPVVVNVQSDLLEPLHTRVVIPLTKAAGLSKKPVSHLTPQLTFDGDRYVLITPQLAVSRARISGRRPAVSRSSVIRSWPPSSSSLRGSDRSLLLGFAQRCPYAWVLGSRGEKDQQSLAGGAIHAPRILNLVYLLD